MKTSVTHTVDADHVAWIEFNDPDSRANVCNVSTLASLSEVLDAIGNTPGVKGVVVVSAKEKIFIAGADLNWLAGLQDEAAATAVSRMGQKLFQRIADSEIPFVCAIHGACAGGGFELALACHHRIASDSPATRVGQPETGIGAIPGWGGCIRLPRLIGAAAAIDHIVKGQLLEVSEAQRVGLIDEIVSPADLRANAKNSVLRLASVEEKTPGRGLRRKQPPANAETFDSFRRTVEEKGRGREPAPIAVIETIALGSQLSVPEALELEARAFGRIVAGEVCKNLIHVFFLREAAKKRTLEGWFQSDGQKATTSPARVARVGVIGAGVMGSGIAHWLAASGFVVVLRDVNTSLVERGLGVVRGLFDDAVRRGKLRSAEAVAGLGRITTTTAWDGFDSCDLVIEAIVEDVDTKKALFTELARVAHPDAILASNTSALPIDEIAGHVPNPERTIGIHFFNPVSRMPLVELVLARATSAGAAERTLALVKSLAKSPVICRSSPGFLVTRVLFFYLNEAVRLWEQGVSAEALDQALRDFGWPMGPLRLIDEIGVDVTDFIFGEMAHYFPTRFKATSACATLVSNGLKGRKNGTGSGFYAYPPEKGAKEVLNSAVVPLTPSSGSTRTPIPKEITNHLMGVMVAEARMCLEEGVVRTPDDVDFALLSGAGFPAFRGGLMRYAAKVSP